MFKKKTGLVLLAPLFLLTAACRLEPVRVTMEQLSFADRQRLDRKALTDAQRAADMTVGTFSDGSDATGNRSTLVSEIHQNNLPGRAVNNLPLADCYWLAADAQGMGGDQIRLSWNTLVKSEPLDDYSSNHIGTCDARDVNTGVPIHRTTSGLEPEPLDFVITVSSEEKEELPALDLLGALLTAHPATEVDPDSRCPGDREFHFSGPEQHVASDPSYLCLSRNGCEVTLCGMRCSFRPSEDLSLRLSASPELEIGDVQIGEDLIDVDFLEIVPRWMKPNLMVVRESRRLARPMTPDSGQLGRFSWATPVIGNAESGTRWHENFSNHVLVESVRLFHRASDGTEVGLDGIDGDRILIRAPDTAYECIGVPTADGTVFDLSEGCNLDGEEVSLLATPTYLLNDLSSIYGEPLTEPLSWEVVFLQDPLAGGGEVLLELNVRSEFGPAALTVDPAYRNLGRRQVGTLVEAEATVTNVGGKTMRVSDVWLDGSAAADFTVAMPTDPRPVPVAIDLRRSETGEFVAEAGSDWDEVPLIEVVVDEPQGLTVTRASAVDGESFQLYGDGADGSGSVLYAHEATADFSGWQPVDVEDRPIARTVWNLRSLPFDLKPGESFPIHFRGRPSQLGSLDLVLHVEAFDVTLPAVKVHVSSNFQLESIPGPIPGLLPERMTIVPERPRQTFLVLNHGALPLVRGFFEITGTDAARFQVVSQHPPNYTVDAGLEEWFQVEYTPDCGYPYPSHFAELRVITDGGDLVLNLVGVSACEPAPGT